MTFKIKQPKLSQQIAHLTMIGTAVANFCEQKLMKIEGNIVYLYPELWQGGKRIESWITNLYLYCRSLNNLDDKTILYFKNIETDEVIGFYDKKPVVLI